MSWNDAIELLSKATPKYTSGGFPLPGETVKPDPIVSPAVKEAKKTELVSNLHSQIRDSAAKKQAGIRDVKQKLNVPASYKGTVAEWKKLSPMAQYKAKGGAVASQATTKDIEGEKFKFKEPSTRSGKLKAKAASAIAAKEDKSSWGLGSGSFITGSGNTGFGVDVPKAAKQVGTEVVVGALTSAFGRFGPQVIKRVWDRLPAAWRQEGTKLVERGGKLSKPYLDKVEGFFTGKAYQPKVAKTGAKKTSKESWGLPPKGTPKKTGSRDLNAPPTPSDIRRAAKAPLPKLEPKGPLRGKPGAAKGKGIGEAKTGVDHTKLSKEELHKLIAKNDKGAEKELINRLDKQLASPKGGPKELARREIGRGKTGVYSSGDIRAAKASPPKLKPKGRGVVGDSDVEDVIAPTSKETNQLTKYFNKYRESEIKNIQSLFKDTFKRRSPKSSNTGKSTLRDAGNVSPNDTVGAGIMSRSELDVLRKEAGKAVTQNNPGLGKQSAEWGREHKKEVDARITRKIKGNPKRQEDLIRFMRSQLKPKVDKSWGEALDLLKAIYDPEALIPASWAGALVIMKSI